MSTASDMAPAAPPSLRRAYAYQGRAAVEARRARAVELYVEAGLSMPRAAVELGVSERTVFGYLHDAGVETRPVGRPPKYPPLEPRVCALEGCEQRFTPNVHLVFARGGGKFCSPACAGEARRVYPAAAERECALAGCNVRFTPPPNEAARGRGKFCSTACAGEAKRVYPRAEERTCAGCGKTFTPRKGAYVAYGGGRYCSTECWGAHRWRFGIALTALVAGWPGRARQEWLGRWGGREAGKLGRGRPRGYTDEQARRVLELRTRNGKLGERAIADRVGLSKRQVHEILVAARRSEVVRNPF